MHCLVRGRGGDVVNDFTVAMLVTNTTNGIHAKPMAGARLMDGIDAYLVTDPNTALLKFSAQEGEYWDNTSMKGLKYVYEAAKISL